MFSCLVLTCRHESDNDLFLGIETKGRKVIEVSLGKVWAPGLEPDAFARGKRKRCEFCLVGQETSKTQIKVKIVASQSIRRIETDEMRLTFDSYLERVKGGPSEFVLGSTVVELVLNTVIRKMVKDCLLHRQLSKTSKEKIVSGGSFERLEGGKKRLVITISIFEGNSTEGGGDCVPCRGRCPIWMA